MGLDGLATDAKLAGDLTSAMARSNGSKDPLSVTVASLNEARLESAAWN